MTTFHRSSTPCNAAAAASVLGQLRRAGRIAAVSAGAMSLCILGNSAQAAAVVPCTVAACTWSLVAGTSTDSGTFSIDPSTGAISGGLPNWSGSGMTASVSLNGLSNSDPLLGFNFSAGTSTAASNFSLTLTMPVAESGPIAANSSVSYSLTANTSAGASVQATSGHVVTAFEESTLSGGPAPLNKGVDVGGNFSFTGGPQVQPSPVYTAANLFSLAAGNQYNEMVVTVAFNLSAQSNVGLSGFVQQLPVPLPASVWLFLSAALGVFGLARIITPPRFAGGLQSP
jgi:hypothetical protein